MSKTTSPQEPAPPYDELFSGHPTTFQLPRFGVSRAYAAVPQNDDDTDSVELASNSESNTNTNINRAHDEESQPHIHSALVIDPTKPHYHCEACDRQLERRQNKRGEARCCLIVALTFIAAFICGTVLGTVIVRANSR